MYSVVLTTALLTGAQATPAWHGHGCWSSCHGCYSSCYCSGSYCSGCYCSGSYCSGCYGCWSSYCYGYGCFGCHGCYSSCSCYGCYSSCYGCYSSCYGCFSSCYGCYSSGGVVVVQPGGGSPGTGGGPGAGGPGGGGTEARLDKIEKTLDKVVDTLNKMKKEGKPKGTEEATAKITVLLPADAQLFVDNVPFNTTSSERSFETPILIVGQKYYYTLKVQMNGQTTAKSQRVTLQAGQHVQVNFNAASGVFTVNAE